MAGWKFGNKQKEEEVNDDEEVEYVEEEVEVEEDEEEEEEEEEIVAPVKASAPISKTASSAIDSKIKDVLLS